MTVFLLRRVEWAEPPQFTEIKFSSERMICIYSWIKFLNKVLDLELSSYWVKKELLKPDYQSVLDSCTKGVNLIFRPSNADNSIQNVPEFHLDKDDLALVSILLQPEFKVKFEGKVDFEESNNMYIRWKR